MLSDNDLERLSAYLDGALTDSERAALEARLSADADLRRELARLRATVDLVRGLPTLAAPRDFTLTPQMVRRPPSILTSAAFSALSAAAAFVLLAAAILLTLPSLSPAPNQTANQVAFAPTQAAPVIQDGLQSDADESPEAAAREREGSTGTLGALQQAQEMPLDLARVTPQPAEQTLEPLMFAAAPESATLAEEPDAASQSQQAGEAAFALEQSPTLDPFAASEASEPSASAGGAASDSSASADAEIPPPLAAFATSAPTEKPSATPTATPSQTPTPTPSPTATHTASMTPSPVPTLVPSPTPSPVPPAGILTGLNSSNIGVLLVVVAVVLLAVALVTTILRRRAR